MKSSRGNKETGSNLFRSHDDEAALFDSSDNNDSESGAGYHSPDVTENNTTNNNDDDSNQEIAKRETADVFRLRLVVLLVLIASAATAASLVWVYITRTEREQFESQFHDDSHKVLEAVGSSLDKTLGLFDSIAMLLVAFAHTTNQTWPFVTIPDFGAQMSKILPLSDSISICVLPIITQAQRKEWEAYSLANDYWVNEAMHVQEDWDGYFGPVIYDGEPQGEIHDDYSPLPENTTLHLPIWQNFPVPAGTIYSYNWDWATIISIEQQTALFERQQTVFGVPYMMPEPDGTYADLEIYVDYFQRYIPPGEEILEPTSDFYYPILDVLDGNNVTAARKTVGLVGTTLYWRETIRNILPEGSHGIHIVVTNECTTSFTYEINGADVRYLGVGDNHDTKYDALKVSSGLNGLGNFARHASAYSSVEIDDEYCPLFIHVYPSDKMKASFTTNNATIFTAATLGIFLFTSIVFRLYDLGVERRQRSVMASALRSNAIVSSLFPSAVRDRLYPPSATPPGKEASSLLPETARSKLQSYLGAGADSNKVKPNVTNVTSSGPIAELYPDTTVLFADIAGFTAWSSVRHPSQVFLLLESVYAGFDAIAKQRGVFKVETVGDSYVAVVGLPTPRNHHAVIMVRFAAECRNLMRSVCADLSKTLGPGTAELGMRFGLNSGPTTAGVLRGEKSRFQLFGDTVNTAARMESNGVPNKIQVSQKTAELIKLAGKGHWLTRRKNKIDCKGKGLLTSYWCEPKAGTGSIASAAESITEDELDRIGSSAPDIRLQELVDWNVNMLRSLLDEVIAARNTPNTKQLTSSLVETKVAEKRNANVGNPLDEVAEVLVLPTLSVKSQGGGFARRDGLIDHDAMVELQELVSTIASLYPANPFHNFDHCSHVAMSTKKLLDRIEEREKEMKHEKAYANSSARKITSDPLTRFAIVFAALIHDLDHPGVSNAQLIEEQTPAALRYKGKSVAEQNSLDLAWDLLMQPQFDNIRQCIFTTEREQLQFRGILINVVMATDLFDKDLKSMREMRWTKSFGNTDSKDTAALSSVPEIEMLADIDDLDANRRATIIIELIIQASDVSHTMQHFTIYRKWNMCLLTEMYTAYVNGRTTKNPLDGWYEGELWFFDNYIIPLAQKLSKCGVFGVSFDEFLDYAQDNRLEWELKGRDIVAQATETLKHLSDTQHPQFKQSTFGI